VVDARENGRRARVSGKRRKGKESSIIMIKKEERQWRCECRAFVPS
jgi:hypothetical protein